MNPLKSRLHSALRSTERFTKVDMVYLSSGSFWSAIGTVFSGLIALATATAFANLLPKTTYGTYQYILSVVGLLGIIGLPGMKTAISYAAARGTDASFFDAIRTRIRWSLISSVGAITIACYYLLQGNILLCALFFIVAASLPIWDVYGSYVPYLQGKKRFRELTFYELGTQLFNALTIIIVMFFTDNLIALVAAYFLSWTLIRYYFYRRALLLAPPNTEHDPSVISYGKHLSLMSVISTIASNADKFLLWHFLGPIQVAIYTFALTVPLRAVGAFASINRLYFPKMTEQSLPAIRKALLARILPLILITLSSALIYIFLAPYLFQIFFPQYLEAIPYTQVAALLIALQPFSLFATALSAHAKKKELYLYNVLPPLLQITLLIILIPLFNILGALFAILGAQLFEGALLTFLFLRTSSVR